MRRGPAISLLGAAVLGGPFAALADVPPSTDLLHIKAAGTPEETVIPALWAQQSGLFARRGFNFEIQSQRSGAAIASGVAGGAYQIGKSSIIPLVIAHARGIPFTLIAPGKLYRASKPNIALIGPADSPITTAAEMNGKTIAVPALDDLFTIGIKLWTDKNGGDSSTLKIVELPVSAVAAALATKRIDAGASDMPTLQQALDSGNARILAHMFDAIAPQLLTTAWFTTRTYQSDHSEIVRGFAGAMREAATYVNDHPKQTVDLLSSFTNIQPAVIAKMVRSQMATVFDPALIQPLVEACVRYKVIATSFDVRDMIGPGLT